MPKKEGSRPIPGGWKSVRVAAGAIGRGPLERLAWRGVGRINLLLLFGKNRKGLSQSQESLARFALSAGGVLLKPRGSTQESFCSSIPKG